ncbi:MAG: transketolase [Aeriscardovia sp.]|nr:transketolase [Aeriscardovia sp.]
MDELKKSNLDEKTIAMSKGLIADAVQKAGSGHPGSAISMTPIVYALYRYVLRHDPLDPKWEGRDRFILSSGHASLSQYVQLFLAGYLTLDDIKGYRTMHSKTPGHPEYGLTEGIEMTTGPLGQGISTAVGFAMASRFQSALLESDLFNHEVWTLCGEGDIEEGVSSEASSLAGTQKLGNLFVIFDCNRIQIEGDTSITLTEDVLARYKSYGWYTDVVDFNSPSGYKEDIQALLRAVKKARKVEDRPHFIQVNTVIAWPTPGKAGSEKTHGSPLGEEAVRDLKKELGLDENKAFQVDADLLAHARQSIKRGEEAKKKWEEGFEEWKSEKPEKAALYERIKKGILPEKFDKSLDDLKESFSMDPLPTRASSGKALNAIAKVMPELWGGSADLGGSNNTVIEGAATFGPEGFGTKQWPECGPKGRVIHFGVREFAMGAVTNGILLGSSTRPFGGTFLQFVDYERAAVRLSALMNIPNIFILTHDSVALGEDGPTHQPIEQLSSLRAMPNLDVIRPCDAFETCEAWREIFEKEGTAPSALILTRQKVPTLSLTKEKAREGLAKGAYVLKGSEEDDLILMASGSEVSLILSAGEELEKMGIMARVVSVPCMEWFDCQPLSYRQTVLPSELEARVAVEAGSAMSWYKYVGLSGKTVCIDRFGLQGSGSENMKALGMTVENVVEKALESLREE